MIWTKREPPVVPVGGATTVLFAEQLAHHRGQAAVVPGEHGAQVAQRHHVRVPLEQVLAGVDQQVDVRSGGLVGVEL